MGVGVYMVLYLIRRIPYKANTRISMYTGYTIFFFTLRLQGIYGRMRL